MAAKVAYGCQALTWIGSEEVGKRPGGSVQLSLRFRDQQKPQGLISAHLQPIRPSTRQGTLSLEGSTSYKNFLGSILESGSFPAPFDNALILKNKSRDIEPYLNGRSIYLVGMMGSGKTTVGKILSQMLGYAFCDSDSLVEEEVGGTSVSEIFKRYGERFFRAKETEVLRKQSLMHRLVISTGGGAVVRPINRSYMQKGISIWLDVPLDALAKRISAIGTGSRPLLNQGIGDVYSTAFIRLSTLLEERADSYANANARVSLEDIAAKLGYGDVSDLTPTTIAIEALEQIENFLKLEGGRHTF